MRERADWILWGSGGHAKVLADVIAAQGGQVLALFDNDLGACACIDGVPLHHREAGFRTWLASRPLSSPTCAAIAIGGSKGSDRRAIGNMLRDSGFLLRPIVHPTASVSPTATVGEGSHVLALAVIAASARLGAMSIINNGAVIEHDCVLEDGVHVAPHATLCGCVVVERDAMVGAGATVLPRLRIGRGSIVGAGAVVTRDVPPGSVVVGNPAKARTHGER